MLTVDLDDRNDVLYINFSSTKNSYGDEIENGIVCLYDMADERLTGLTIFDFIKKYHSGSLIGKPYMKGIDLEAQIIPMLKKKYSLKII